MAAIADRLGDPTVAGVIPFYQRKLDGDDFQSSLEEARFLTNLYPSLMTVADRRRVSTRLDELRKDPAVAAEYSEGLDAFNAARERDGAYLSGEMFALVHE